MLGIKEIQEILPHRHPFLLVDCIEEYEPGVRAIGYKCVTFNEPFFAGHFPCKGFSRLNGKREGCRCAGTPAGFCD